MARPRAQYTILTDLPEVRVAEWRNAPGNETGQHTYPKAGGMIALSNGTLTQDADGERTRTIERGKSYTRPPGVEHNVRNRTDDEIVTISIDAK